MRRSFFCEVTAAQGPNGFTPLCAAVEGQNLSAVAALLRHGANANAPAADGRTPLLMAVGRLGLALDSDEGTMEEAIDGAVDSKSAHVARFLLAAGAVLVI